MLLCISLRMVGEEKKLITKQTIRGSPISRDSSTCPHSIASCLLLVSVGRSVGQLGIFSFFSLCKLMGKHAAGFQTSFACNTQYSYYIRWTKTEMLACRYVMALCGLLEDRKRFMGVMLWFGKVWVVHAFCVTSFQWTHDGIESHHMADKGV